MISFRLTFILITSLFLAACNNSPNPTTSIEISMDIPCELATNTAVPLSVRGQIPSDAQITWEAIHGEIEPNTGTSVIYIGPEENTEDIITVSIDAGEFNTIENLHCSIISPTIAPDSLVESEEEETPNESQPTSTPFSTNTPIPTPTIQQEQTIDAQPSSEEELTTIAITEVMGNPCGEGVNYEKPYEYIEIFNYGDKPIDIDGWWFTDHGNNNLGHPDKLVSWNQRYPFHSLGDNVITDSTILEPNQYAVVLAPLYPFGVLDPPPYEISTNTVIMTIDEGDRLGDDKDGILSAVSPLDVIVLYIGTEEKIETLVSTYGAPNIDSDNPLDVYNDGLHKIPLNVDDCFSAHRVQALGPDVESNWESDLVTPGSAYQP